MRPLIVTLGLVGWVLISGAALADEIPPLVYCSVDPWDQMEQPRVIGIPNYLDGVWDPAKEADILITLLDDNYQPLPGIFIEVLIDWQCAGGEGPVCVCDDAELTGYTDEDGQLTLNMAFGGCCDAPDAVEIRAHGMTVRQEEPIVSPDWDGERGDCEVSLADFIPFSRGYETQAGGCTDYSGDGETTLVDFVIFGGGWGRDCASR